jgi:hypothetical protein
VLAAAYAECGKFEDAAALAEKALELASSAGRADIQERLRLYQAGLPYRQQADKP